MIDQTFPVHDEPGKLAPVPPTLRLVTITVGDLGVLLDRIVYGGSLPDWTPDRIEDLDADVLEVVARCLRAWDKAEAE